MYLLLLYGIFEIVHPMKVKSIIKGEFLFVKLVLKYLSCVTSVK